jgi:hypothetical protein
LLLQSGNLDIWYSNWLRWLMVSLGTIESDVHKQGVEQRSTLLTADKKLC